jgi:hypothetical protein
MVSYKAKMKLHETHKRLKVGLLQWEEVDPDTQVLLKRYYNYDDYGVQL